MIGAMASSLYTAATFGWNFGGNFEGAHCLIFQGGFPPCSVFIADRFPFCIETGRRCDHASRTRSAMFNFSRSNNSAFRQLLARARTEPGKPRLKEVISGKEFFLSPLVISGAPAEVKGRVEDSSLDGPVLDDLTHREEKVQGDIPDFWHGVQPRTAELDLGDDFEEREQEVARGLLAVQVVPPLEIAVHDLEAFDEQEGVSIGSTLVERSEQEPNVLNGECFDLMLEEENLKAEQMLQEELAKKSKQEEAAYRGELLKLASKNTYINSKIFFYPDPAVAISQLEIFLNREISALANQPTIFIKGGFNDWRWKSFVVELKKSELPGDWWSCKIEIPKEAYKVDFIFFDGQNIFENNSKSDFFILVKGGIRKVDFEYFLLEAKAREAQLLAEEKATKKRLAAEEHRVVMHKVAELADRAQAQKLVIEKKGRARGALQKAVRRVDGVWYIEPSEFGGGECATLYYNRASRPLAYSKEVWVHGGANNWDDMVSIVEKLLPARIAGGDWWSAEVDVPEKAYMLNWVFADGPPDAAQLYDNNNYQDFHAVAKTAAEETYWGGIEEDIYQCLRKKTLEKESAAQKKVEHRQQVKEEMKVKTMHTFSKSQAHIFYTEPPEVRAGEEVAIFYNPSNTVLSGKPEVYIRGSFNRWTYRHGHFPTTKLTGAANGTHLMMTVKVPRDAYVIDFVFSERGDNEGGDYDNRNGLDYHVPVTGSTLRQPPLDIIHIALEMAPIAKVGGLGDVVTSLSRAIEEQGHSAEVVVPKYDCLNYKYIEDLHEVNSFYFGGTIVRVWNGKVEGLTVHFLEPENGIFWVGCVYGRRDDASRFGFFCHAALEYLLQSGRHPDIIHCHDWSSAPVTWLFQEHYKRDNLANAHIIFTIHNLEFGAAQIGKAMANSHMATTVSPTYAKEVSGNPVIAPHLYKFHGILNGIDPDIWDPYFDPFIPVAYTTENANEGKKAAKEALQCRLGLRKDDCPLVGIITRLTAQKGIDLIKHGIWRTLDRGGQVVLLGSAPDPRIQNDFVGLANQLYMSHGDMARLWLSYDEPLSHLIYAGADFILIPSIFEPCGLTQLTAMRYGAIPIVRQTGGLYDTVFDVDHDQHRAREHGVDANGFSFVTPDVPGLDYALNRGITAWYESRSWLEELSKKVLQQDWTWNRPALDYIELYNGARKLP